MLVLKSMSDTFFCIFTETILTLQNTRSMKTYRFFVLLLSFSVIAFAANAQGDFCSEATEFCPFGNEDAVTFPAGVNVAGAHASAPGNDYGCLSTTPNPAWYYLQVGIPGDIQINLTNSNDVDIDFALWGPFDNLNAALNTCDTLNSPFDCSYSASENETVNIPFAQSGNTYILLITNFSNQPTDIFGTATGEGQIAYCMLALDQGESCAASSRFDCYCRDGGLDLKLTNNAPAMPVGICADAEANYRWAAFDACYCSASVEISAQNCPPGQTVNARLFSALRKQSCVRIFLFSPQLPARLRSQRIILLNPI